MALTNGDPVSPHLKAANVTPQPQPPKFGVVDLDSGVDVLWEDGLLQTAITALSLDKIEPPAADGLSGQRVIVNLSPGAGFQAATDYQGIVLMVFKRDQADGGTATEDLALVKLISTGAYLEVLASVCTVVPGS